MVTDTVTMIAGEISRMAGELSPAQFTAVTEKILRADKVFTAGAGRAGEMMRCMAKRLMHIGIHSYVLGETVTPPAAEDDFLLIGSGSGETESLVVLAGKAKRLGVSVGLITTNAESTLGGLADVVAVIPSSTPKSAAGETKSAQPMANLFEQLLLIVGDAICMEAARGRGMSDEAMFARHANLE